MQKYAKAYAALLTAIIAGLTAAQSLLADGFQVVDGVSIAIPFLGALAVYVTPNKEMGE